MSDPDERNDPPRPFMEHICALRDSVLGMAASWVLCVIVAGVFSPQINKWIFGPAETCDGISMARPISCPKCSRPYAVSEKVNYCLDCGALLNPEAKDKPVPRKATCVYCEAKYVEPDIPNFCGVCGREIPRDPGAKGAEAGKDGEDAKHAQHEPVRHVSIEGLDLTSGFDAIIMIALWGGTALSFPFLMFYLLKFVFPALTRREKNSILFCLGAGTAFFAVGAWMAYAKTLPVVVKVFLSFADWVNLPVYTVKADGYIRIVLKTILAFGIALQLPLLVFVLGWIGVISSSTLRHYRRLAIVVIFVLGMVLTPPDPLSQILMALPMVLLYELCIWLIKLREIATGRGSS